MTDDLRHPLTRWAGPAWRHPPHALLREQPDAVLALLRQCQAALLAAVMTQAARRHAVVLPPELTPALLGPWTVPPLDGLALPEPDDLPAAYERSLALQPCVTEGSLAWRPARKGGLRRQWSVYSTPPDLVRCLLDHVLNPALRAACRERDPEAALLRLRVIDPAAGTGAFLLAAAERLTHALVRVRRSRSTAAPAFLWQAARRDVAEHCLFGVEADPLSAALCRWRIWWSSVCSGMAPDSSVLARHILCGDGLRESPVPGPFAVVLGNPPFASVVDGMLSPASRELAPQLHPGLRGALDGAHLFFARGLQLVQAGGRLGMVLPRPALNAPALAQVRRQLTDGLRLNLLYSPERSDLFAGALVFPCLVGLGPAPRCRISRHPRPQAKDWVSRTVRDHHWWRTLQDATGPVPGPRSARHRTLSQWVEITASMTAGEAYQVRPFLVDQQEGGALKFVTTGLIDPGQCHWGTRRCRYLRADYAYPRLPASDNQEAALRRRIARARRPKVLVAGLSRRLEAFLDDGGEYIGAVATFSLQHPQDDLALLGRICCYLHSPEADEWFRRELSGNAVGGGDTVMKKAFLQDLPVPEM